MNTNFLLRYDPISRQFHHFAVINGNEVQGNWPIYYNDADIIIDDVVRRINAKHKEIAGRNFDAGSSDADKLIAEKHASGEWFTADELKAILVEQKN